VTALRTAGASRDYSLEEVARFYAFLMSVKSLSRRSRDREPDSTLVHTAVFPFCPESCSV
jgi:hypothetical protein